MPECAGLFVFLITTLFEGRQYQRLRAVADRRVYYLPITTFMNDPVEDPLLLDWLVELAYPTRMPCTLRERYRVRYQEAYGHVLTDDEIDSSIMMFRIDRAEMDVAIGAPGWFDSRVHDTPPQHAVAVADNALLMVKDQFVHGPVDSVLTEANLQALYGVPMRQVAFEHDGRSVRTLVPVFDSAP